MIRLFPLFLAVSFAFNVMAAGPPANPGPPSFITVTPLQLVDANGVVIGELVGDQERPALVKYVLAGGDVVLLDASPTALQRTSSGQLFFFGSTDCTGPVAYAFPSAPGSQQLAKRQAAVVHIVDVDGLPTSSLLYVSDPFSPSVPLAAMTATSRWTIGNCNTSPFLMPAGNYVKFTQVEDLATKFTLPYWVP